MKDLFGFCWIRVALFVFVLGALGGGEKTALSAQGGIEQEGRPGGDSEQTSRWGGAAQEVGRPGQRAPGRSSRDTTTFTGISGGDVALGDVNGDGRPDLVVTGNTSAVRSRPRTTLYLSRKDGTFDRRANAFPNVMGGAVAVGDIGNDGGMDVLLTGGRADGRVASLYRGDGEGSFTQAEGGLTGVAGGSASMADVNRDGHLDLLITGRRPAQSDKLEAPPTATLYLGDGAGDFRRASADLHGVADGSASIGDVNEDGHPDLLIAGTDTSATPSTRLYLGDGAGGFTVANAGLVGLTQGTTAIGDLTGDGHADLLVTGLNDEERPTTQLYVGNGRGEFEGAEAGFPDVVAGDIALGDVDEDGLTDVLMTGETADGTPTASVYLGGDGTRFARSKADLSGTSFSNVAMADLDGNENLDFLITGEGPSGRPTMRLYVGDGRGGVVQRARE